MSLKTCSFKLPEKLNLLINEEIKKGIFINKSDFFRQLIREWVRKNHPEILKN